ncbi:MAG TPA: GNAT family N-acetyltransferase [Usitatibacter sp.]|nr:GNAT family N-acetyltransferase [Usitatibacter sp.]
MIRKSRDTDVPVMVEIVNAAAQAYRGAIPADRWHDPYMPRAEMEKEISDGVAFWVAEEGGRIVAIMGIQDKGDVALVRHAYVRPTLQRTGLGSKLLKHVQALTARPVLIGTWAAATWAIDFYRRNGFTLVTEAEKSALLKKYWSIPERQIETSVVLADKSWTDKKFAGSIPKIYDTYMVPLIFQPYAADLAARLAPLRPSRVLEIAAGTGVVTRQLAATLAADVSITATDLNPPMLDMAKEAGTVRPVEWQQADAMQLPFDAASFDAVVCQFGAMFFPDKGQAFAQARRVLRPGGTFLFNVWDRIEEYDFADEVTRALATLFPQDPPRFMARIPHGYHERGAIERDLYAGGFNAKPRIETIAARSRASSPLVPAMAYCEGTPLRSEIEARDASRLAEATHAAAKAIEKRFGSGDVDGKIQAHVVTIPR